MRVTKSNPRDPIRNEVPQKVAAPQVSAKDVSSALTPLTDCLLDADAAASARFGRGRRKSLGASAVVQFFALAVLLIYPLFATGSRLIAKPTVVLPPYGRMPHANRPSDQQQSVPPRVRNIRVFQDVLQFHPPTDNRTKTPDNPVPPQNFGDYHPNVLGSDSDSNGPGIPGLIDLPGAKSSTPPPPTSNTSAPPSKAPIAMSQGAVLASLIHRIEPVYPIIAKELRLEGVVELRAIIARDGTVQQLELVSGNPILARAAREAVLQWRFRPALLNGQPVEVDTYFTVTFHLGQ